MSNLLDQLGGASVINRAVTDFYQALGRHLSAFESCDHRKQEVRQARFLNNAAAPSSNESARFSRAEFLARGVNGPLFEALLEYLQPRLEELGVPGPLGRRLVRKAEGLYDRCNGSLSLAS